MHLKTPTNTYTTLCAPSEHLRVPSSSSKIHRGGFMCASCQVRLVPVSSSGREPGVTIDLPTCTGIPFSRPIDRWGTICVGCSSEEVGGIRSEALSRAGVRRVTQPVEVVFPGGRGGNNTEVFPSRTPPLRMHQFYLLLLTVHGIEAFIWCRRRTKSGHMRALKRGEPTEGDWNR